MTFYIVKPDKDVDLYVMMDSIPDLPKFWGTRKEFIKMTKKQGFIRRFGTYSTIGPFSMKAQLDRCDRTSCSSMVLAFSWDEDEHVDWLNGYILRSELKYVLQLLQMGVPYDDEMVRTFWNERDESYGE